MALKGSSCRFDSLACEHGGRGPYHIFFRLPRNFIHFFINLKYYQGVVYNALSQASLNELFFPVNIDWNRFPVESVLRALDPVLGHECFSACLGTSWTETGWIRWKEVDSRRSGEHFDEISVTWFLRWRTQQNLAKSRYVVRNHPQKTRKWRTTRGWGNLCTNLIYLQYLWFATQRRRCPYY